MATSERGTDAAPTVERPRTKTRLKAAAIPDVPEPGPAPTTIGRYEVVDVIGRGAMGVVYKARDPLLDRIVAIKTIHAPTSLGKNVRKAYYERFEREAKAAARMSHPAIVTIFDVGLDREAPFLVMEYLPGETLADRLDRERIPLGQAVQCARDLASALGFAHRERIVHRDVKPANVLHAGESRWKLADFGIARLPDSDLTQIGIFMGTPGYAPPEAIREGAYTIQADVFAWGAVFYELLCGRVPYEGPDTRTTNGYVLRAEPPSPREVDALVPEPLAEVALRALAHDTRRRYSSGAEAEKALNAAWERSLAGGLVPVSALSSSAEPVAWTPRPAPASPPPLPVPDGASSRAAGSTADGFRDDAPTLIDEKAAERAHKAAQSGKAPRAPGPGAAVERSDRLHAAAALARAQRERRGPSTTAPSRPVPPGNRLWVFVTVALVAAVIGAVAAFYLIRLL